jgi:hypothetical protein
MKLNIKIETDKKVCNDILCAIIGFAASYDAKTLEIEGLDTCEPFFTDEEIADIIKKVKGKKFYQINKISVK